MLLIPITNSTYYWLPWKPINITRNCFTLKIFNSFLSFFPSSFQDPALANYKLTGVADAFSKHKDSGESKGVKAHFRLDESGLLNLDQVSLIKNISN